MLAASLLGECEFHKAEKLFLTAAKGIYTDQFFADRIKAESTPELPNRTFITYYLKVRIEKAIFTVQHYIFIFSIQVIQLFELHNARDCAINVATTALSIADKQDPYRVN